MPDAVHQEKHLLNISNQSPSNSHSLSTLNASSVGVHRHIDRSKCPAVNKECHNCKIIGHFDRVCKKPSVTQDFMPTQVKHIQSPAQSASQPRIHRLPPQNTLHFFFTLPTEVQTEAIHQIWTAV